jgi:hypothetical protein
VLVQLLVGEVDEELLERVALKVLEAVDVEDADEALGRPASLRRPRRRSPLGYTEKVLRT